MLTGLAKDDIDRLELDSLGRLFISGFLPFCARSTGQWVF